MRDCPNNPNGVQHEYAYVGDLVVDQAQPVCVWCHDPVDYALWCAHTSTGMGILELKYAIAVRCKDCGKTWRYESEPGHKPHEFIKFVTAQHERENAGANCANGAEKYIELVCPPTGDPTRGPRWVAKQAGATQAEADDDCSEELKRWLECEGAVFIDAMDECPELRAEQSYWIVVGKDRDTLGRCVNTIVDRHRDIIPLWRPWTKSRFWYEALVHRRVLANE